MSLSKPCDPVPETLSPLLPSEVLRTIKEDLAKLQYCGVVATFADNKTATTTVTTTTTHPTIPSRKALGKILLEEKAALMFMEQKGIIEVEKYCPHCKNPLVPASRNMESTTRFNLRCRRRKCVGYTTSMFSGSIIANCRFDKAVFLDLVYLWLVGNKASQIKTTLGVSNRTVTDWSNYLRETVTADLLYNTDTMIGGPGIIVEIDESKFGKRKYHVSRFLYSNRKSRATFHSECLFTYAHLAW